MSETNNNGSHNGDSEPQPDSPHRSSRRAALKAGVGAGVGLIAWSGPTITSLGGTPAYAQGCTFVQIIDIGGGCRNTDQRDECSTPLFAYHELKFAKAVPGFAIDKNIKEGTCCGTGATAVLSFPAGITCVATTTLYGSSPGNCNPKAGFTTLQTGKSESPITIGFPCFPPPGAVPNSFYTITLKCNTTGAPAECLE